MFVSLVKLKTKNILRTCKNIWSASSILCISVEHGTPRSLIIMSLSKKKELLVLGATAVGCAAAAAAAGYSFFNKENQPDQPKKKLIETAKDTILEKEMQHASSAFDDENEIKNIEAKASEGTWHRIQ